MMGFWAGVSGAVKGIVGIILVVVVALVLAGVTTWQGCAIGSIGDEVTGVKKDVEVAKDATVENGKAIAGVKTELKDELKAVKAEVAGFTTELTQVKTEQGEVKTSLRNLRDDLDHRGRKTDESLEELKKLCGGGTVVAPAPTPAAPPAVAPSAPVGTVASAPTPTMAPVVATGGVPVEKLLEALNGSNPATSQEAVLQISNRPDAVVALLEQFAGGELQKQRLAWACLREMGGPARDQLNTIVGKPNEWDPKVVAAAREILLKGFRQQAEIEDGYGLARENSHRVDAVQELIDGYMSDAQRLRDELNKTRRQVGHVREYGKKQDSILARALERKMDALQKQLDETKAKLLELGIKPEPTTVYVPIYRPTGLNVSPTYGSGYRPGYSVPCR